MLLQQTTTHTMHLLCTLAAHIQRMSAQQIKPACYVNIVARAIQEQYYTSCAQIAAHYAEQCAQLRTRWQNLSPHAMIQELLYSVVYHRVSLSVTYAYTAVCTVVLNYMTTHTPKDPMSMQVSAHAIRYSFHGTPFGLCLLAYADRAICHLSFLEDSEAGRVQALSLLQTEWPTSILVPNTSISHHHVVNLFKPYSQYALHTMLLMGTHFQKSVWEMLHTIPYGTTVSYRAIAQALQKPHAVRAVARAIAANKIAYLIPCHRVITSSGKVHKYRWGSERKQYMIDTERASIIL